MQDTNDTATVASTTNDIPTTTTNNTAPCAAPSMAPRERADAAYQEVAREIAAVPDDRVLMVNIDVVAAIFTARGAVEAIRKLRPYIVQQLPSVDVAAIDKIDTYAAALGKVHGDFKMASTSVEELPELVERATALRDTLVADATALARRGYLDASVLDARPRGPGYKNLYAEVLAVVGELRRHWGTIGSRSAIAYEELDEADALVLRISTLAGLREQAPSSTVTALTLERQKAFTLFTRAYDEARRAATFLRWEQGDVDTLVPSLYAGRGNGGRKKSEAVSAPAGSDANAAAQASDASMPNEAAALAMPSHGAAPVPALPALAKGFPGSDPFAPS